MTFHLRATGRHLPYGITQCYLPPAQGNSPRLTPAMQAGTRFTYPGGMEGWVDLVTPNHCTTKTTNTNVLWIRYCIAHTARKWLTCGGLAAE